MPQGHYLVPNEDSPGPAERALCRRRGYCGPFVNRAYYDAQAGCARFGDCIECGRTVSIPSRRPFDGVGAFIEAILPPPPTGA